MLNMTVSVNNDARETTYRLSTFIKLSLGQIILKVDPDSPSFSGKKTITNDVAKTTGTIGFYQKGLNIQQVYLTDGNTRIPLTVSSSDYGIEHGKASQNIAVNHYKLHIAFDGNFNSTSDDMCLSKFEGLNYIFTQCENMYARCAFPTL